MSFCNSIKLEKGMYNVGGKSFTKVLEELDPSENYIGTNLEGLDAYHLFRDYYPNSRTLAQNSDLIYFNSEQYNRIFNVTDTEEDHFYMIYRLRVKAQRPMKNLSQSMPFDDNDLEHRRKIVIIIG